MAEKNRPISGFNRTHIDSLIEVNLDAELLKRLTMPNDGIVGLENCNCEDTTKAVIKTVWSGSNKGRRIMTCAADKGKQCFFNVWLDAPFNPRATAVIEHLYHIIERLEFENSVGMGLQKIQWVAIEEKDISASNLECSTSGVE